MRIANCWPTTKVVASGNTTVCVVLPVNCWLYADETLRVVVPAAVAVVAKFSIKLLAWVLALASRPITLDAVAAVTSDVEPVPPLATGRAVPDKPNANVPVVVTGLPEIDMKAGTDTLTDVTVPEPVAGVGSETLSTVNCVLPSESCTTNLYEPDVIHISADPVESKTTGFELGVTPVSSVYVACGVLVPAM